VRECGGTRQNNADLGVLFGLAIDPYRPRMLFDDDVVADGQAKASALSGWFGREEGIEHLLLYVRRNAGAVVANPDLYAVAKVLSGRRKSGLVAFAVILLFAFVRCIEAVGDQVQESPCDLLREYIDFTGGRTRDRSRLIWKL
jgi:hypothetical protein